MKTLTKRSIACVLAAIGVAGCGVVYEPQEFSESAFSYGFKGDFETFVEVVPLTFETLRTANSDGYTPRPLPAVLAQNAPVSNLTSMQERLSAAGLDRIAPASSLEVPQAYAPYDSASQVLQPALRRDDYQPLPVYDLTPGALSVQGAGIDQNAGYGGGGQLYGSAGAVPLPPPNASRVDPLDPLVLRREPSNNPLPDSTPPIYRIGPGDILGLQSRARVLPSITAAETDGGGIAGELRLLVQDNGEIFVPEVGTVRVGGLTLPEARERIFDLFVKNQIGFDTAVEIIEFGSKRIAVSGLKGNELIPVRMRPTTLGEAVTLSGGLGSNPENLTVRVLRDGVVHEMRGDAVASRFARRTLLAGDIVSVAPAYDVELALTYFDQQVRLAQLEQTRLTDAISRRGDARAAEGAEREKLRLEIAIENYRLEAERLRQQAQIEGLRSQRESGRLNEDSRIENMEARQTYLRRLRELQELNREAERRLRAETRDIVRGNQSERSRERSERLQLLELLLQDERQQLQQRASERQEARTLFSERLRLGAIERDYVTVAGETRNQTTMPLPFGTRLTLNRVLYEESNGINPITGDPSEIYIFRAPPKSAVRQDRLIAYHLDAQNPAALVVASQFEMRPNDVVYVNPQPLTNWNRVLSQLLPSTGLLQTGINAAGI